MRNFRIWYGTCAMRKFFRVFSFSLILIFFLASVSCNGKNRNQIQLDKSDSISLSPSISWALVVTPYVPYYSSPAYKDISSQYCRRGDILQVMATSFSDGTWYKLEGGWVPASSVKVYSNKYRAETEKNTLIEN